MKDFFVPKDLLLFSSGMRMNTDFSVRGFNGGQAWASGMLTVRVILMSSFLFGGSGNEQSYSSAKCPDGTLVFVGAQNTITPQRPFVFKVSQDRTSVLWAYTYTMSSSDLLTSVCVDSSGNIYVGGGYRASGSGLRVLAKLDGDGNVVWCKSYGIVNYSNISGVTVADDGNLYVCIFDTAYYHYYAKISSTDGSIIWFKRYSVTSWTYMQSGMLRVGSLACCRIWSHATSTNGSSPNPVGAFSLVDDSGNVSFYRHSTIGSRYVHHVLFYSAEEYFLTGTGVAGRFNTVSNQYSWLKEYTYSNNTTMRFMASAMLPDNSGILSLAYNPTAPTKISFILLDLNGSIVWCKSIGTVVITSEFSGASTWSSSYSLIHVGGKIFNSAVNLTIGGNPEVAVIEFEYDIGPEEDFWGFSWFDDTITVTDITETVVKTTPALTTISITPSTISTTAVNCLLPMSVK